MIIGEVFLWQYCKYLICYPKSPNTNLYNCLICIWAACLEISRVSWKKTKHVLFWFTKTVWLWPIMVVADYSGWSFCVKYCAFFQLIHRPSLSHCCPHFNPMHANVSDSPTGQEWHEDMTVQRGGKDSVIKVLS